MKTKQIFRIVLLLSLILSGVTINISAASKWEYNNENIYQITEEINKVSSGTGQKATIIWDLDKTFPDDNHSGLRIDNDTLKDFYSGVGCRTYAENDGNRTLVYSVNSFVEKATKKYYKAQHGIDADFSCKKPNDPSYKEIIATYTVTGESKIKNLGRGQGSSTANITKHYQTTIYTNADLETQNLTLDAEDGKLIVSGTLARDTDAWNITYISIKEIIAGVTAICFLCCAVAFVIMFTQLGINAHNYGS